MRTGTATRPNVIVLDARGRAAIGESSCLLQQGPCRSATRRGPFRSDPAAGGDAGSRSSFYKPVHAATGDLVDRLLQKRPSEKEEPMMRRHLAALAALGLLWARPAAADTLLSGFAGAAFGGSTQRSRGTYGGSLAFLGNVAGFEVEFATTPDFFGESREDVFTDNNVLTLMGSLLVAFPPGPVRVYGVVGGGLLKTPLADPGNLFDVDSNDFGINAGGGVLIFLGDHFGLRGDIRYFRDLQNDDDGDFDIDFGNVDYWRAVGGITLKF